MINEEQLLKIMPLARERIKVFLGPLNSAMAEFEINTPLRVAAFLAQIAVESGQLQWVEELSSGKQYDGRHGLGNARPEAVAIAAKHMATPGPWWKGHGLIQVTGYDNHKACGEALGIDLLNEPLKLTEPLNAARSAGWFWVRAGLNKLADYSMFVRITRRINGGTNGLELRQRFYAKAREVLAC